LKKSPHYRGDDVLQPPRLKWTDEEHERFFDAIKTYGRNYVEISEAVGSKTTNQVKQFAERLKDKIKQNPGHKHAELLPMLQEEAKR